MTNLQTLKPANLTPNQAQAAKRFSAQHGDMTVSQAAKWLNYIFALKRGEITLERFQQATGHDGTPFTKYIKTTPCASAACCSRSWARYSERSNEDQNHLSDLRRGRQAELPAVQ